MNLKYLVCMLFIATTIILAPGCISQEQGSEATTAVVPTENLPEGFQLIAVLNESTPGVNMEDEIEDFRGDEEIGQVEATVGVYQWGELGKDYDARVTVMECENENFARAAVSNYITQPDFQKPPLKGVDRFSTAVVNGHEVTEIREKVGKSGIRYLYIWNNENQVVLVEGNGNPASSRELAKATGL
jgi:hypothetical protein